MVILMHLRLADIAGHKAEGLNLCIDIEGSVHNLLHDIRNAVRAVDVGIFCNLINEGHIPLRLEQAPQSRKVLGRGDNGVLLDIEVSGIIPSANCKAWNVLQRLVFSIVLRSLTIAVVNIDVCGSHNGVVHIGPSVPYAIGFIHLHMVHSHYKGDIHRGVPLVRVDVPCNREGISPYSVILNGIETFFAYLREICGEIVVAVIEHAPRLGFRLQDSLDAAVGVELEYSGAGLGRGVAVNLDDGCLLLGRGVTDL